MPTERRRQALPRLSSSCFGTGSEHSLNLLRWPYRPEAANGCLVLRRAGTTRREALVRTTWPVITYCALSRARPGYLRFSLTSDSHGGRQSGTFRPGGPVAGEWSATRKFRPAASDSLTRVLADVYKSRRQVTSDAGAGQADLSSSAQFTTTCRSVGGSSWRVTAVQPMRRLGRC